MKWRSADILGFLFFFLIGLLSIYLSYHKYDLRQLGSEILKADFRWYFPVLIATILCHFSRAARWKLLLEGSGEKIRLMSSLQAVMSGYFVNFLTPRLGEIARCVVLRSTDQIPIEKSLATVFIERVVDVISLFLIFCIILALYYGRLVHFWQEKLLFPMLQWFHQQHSLWMIALVLFFLSLLLLSISIWLYRKREHLNQRIRKHLDNLKDGLFSIARMKNKYLFLFHTVFIWLMYHFMTWFWFFGMPETRHLGPVAALFVITFGGIARALPVQAYGMGLYQTAVMQVLLMLGVAGEAGLKMGTIIYSGQTLFYLIIGGAFFAHYLLFRRKGFQSTP